MIDKQTQDQAWACAPKAFREAIKKEYRRLCILPRKEPYDLGQIHILETSFGYMNLTSDAEPEVMISISRKQVQKDYALHKAANNHTICNILYTLFGSKCLPDEPLSQNSVENCDNENLISKSEPKFKVGDKVRTVFNEITHITAILGNGNYYLYGMGNEYPEDSLTLVESYIEPTQTNDNTEDKYFCNNGSCPFNGVGYLEENQCDKVLCNKRVPKQLKQH